VPRQLNVTYIILLPVRGKEAYVQDDTIKSEMAKQKLVLPTSPESVWVTLNRVMSAASYI
jgi:hypothetical protein